MLLPPLRSSTCSSRPLAGPPSSRRSPRTAGGAADPPTAKAAAGAPAAEAMLADPPGTISSSRKRKQLEGELDADGCPRDSAEKQLRV